MSPYAFCNNNPLYFVDPTGMAPTDWYLNLITGNVSWKEGTGSRLGYSNLGHSWGSTDVNGNRFLMNGDTKQISYNGKVVQDFNNNTSAFDITNGFTIWGKDRSGDTSGLKGRTTDSFESDDIPTLANGDGTARSRTIDEFSTILDQIIKFFEVVDAAGDTMDRVPPLVPQKVDDYFKKKAVERAEAKKNENTPQKPEDIYWIIPDKKNPENNTWLNKNNYNKDGSAKKNE